MPLCIVRQAFIVPILAVLMEITKESVVHMGPQVSFGINAIQDKVLSNGKQFVLSECPISDGIFALQTYCLF